MTGRKLCSPAEGELTRRRERASMVGERVAETYPEHGIAWMLPDGGGKRLGCFLRLAPARIGFGNHQPVLGRTERAEKSVPELRQWNRRRLPLRAPRRSRESGQPLDGIAGGSEQQGRRRELEHRAAHSKSPQESERKGENRENQDPRGHDRFLRMRPATIAPPKISRITGAAQSGQLIGSAVGR